MSGQTRVERGEVIQSLWSGYGEIVRYHLHASPVSSAVLKRVIFPEQIQHPRGWSGERSHQRKLESYRIESHWYQHWGQHALKAQCCLPRFYGLHTHARGYWMLLEDLNASGFPERHRTLDSENSKAVLRWLARFHARFLNLAPQGLWERGNYWHLATRPDEFEALAEGPLKSAAQRLDQALRTCPYQTLLHGDAKLANFCFGPEAGMETQVAAVDFQYVGPGVGIQDVVYFLGSCFDSAGCERHAEELLDFYFQALRQALQHPDQHTPQRSQPPDLDDLEHQWRQLYPVAWADFQRFLMGWMPEHPKLNAYSQKMTDKALSEWGQLSV